MQDIAAKDVSPTADTAPRTASEAQSGVKDGAQAAGQDLAETAPAAEERPTLPAVLRGWRRRCPNCGQGPLLTGYLKMRDSCPVCHQALHHARADDGPAYLTILLVGHLMAPTLLMAFEMFRPDPLVLFTIFAVGCTALSLYLLPRLKGVIVAIQWSRYMHGFGTAA